MDSKMFSINLKDFAKGAIVAVIGAVVVYLYGLVQGQGLEALNFDEIIKVALSTFLGYMIKNFFTDSQGDFAGIK